MHFKHIGNPQDFYDDMPCRIVLSYERFG